LLRHPSDAQLPTFPGPEGPNITLLGNDQRKEVPAGYFCNALSFHESCDTFWFWCESYCIAVFGGGLCMASLPLRLIRKEKRKEEVQG
jgi:hypothetical protein